MKLKLTIGTNSSVDSSLGTRYLAFFWNYLREVCGENDYARYLADLRHHGGDRMTAQQFYLAAVERKHSKINRCC